MLKRIAIWIFAVCASIMFAWQFFKTVIEIADFGQHFIRVRRIRKGRQEAEAIPFDRR